jgi:hypothetical protein
MMPGKIKFGGIEFKRPKAVLNFAGFVMEVDIKSFKFQQKRKREGLMRVGTRLSIWEKFKCRFKQFCFLGFLYFLTLL